MKNEQLAKDLCVHFTNKLHNQVCDIIITCESIELGNNATAELVVRGLISQTVNFCISMEIDQKTFIQLCTLAYKEVKKLTEDAKTGQR